MSGSSSIFTGCSAFCSDSATNPTRQEIFIGAGLCNCFGLGTSSPLGSPVAGSPAATGSLVPQLVQVLLPHYVQAHLENINLTPELLKADLEDLKTKGQTDIGVCALMISCALRLYKISNGGNEVNLNEVLDNGRVFHVNDVGSQKQFIFTSNDQEYMDSVTCLSFQGLKSLTPPGNFEDFYNNALRTCVQFNAVGGKSGASFYITDNRYFVIKEIKQTEFETFQKFGDKYINHLADLTTLSCLNKPLGVYKVVRNHNTAYVLVTENIKIQEGGSMVLYDLKGVPRRSSNPATIGLDENFADDMADSGFSLSNKDMKDLLACVQNDCHFLQSVSVMDYSLLLVWHKQEEAISYGIIDYLSRFTFLKMGEFIYKSSKNLVNLKWEQPTVVPPRIYGNRLNCFLKKTCKTAPNNEEMSTSDAAAEVMTNT